MKALVLKEHGTLENVAYMDVPRPEVGPDDVLVEIKAAALNRLDLWLLPGWSGLHLAFPHIMGCDGSGIVAETGSNVTDFAAGDRVAINPTYHCGRCEYCLSGRDQMCNQFAIFGEHIPGFYADYQTVPARNLVKLPEHVSFELAAAASLVYVTAWHSLIAAGKFQAGEDILIVGAGGGVNTACIDIARLAGAGTIYVVGSTDEKLAQAEALGANVLINRQKEDWGKAVFKASNRRGVDVVVDNVGAATYVRSLRALRKGGRLLTVGNTSGPNFEFENRYMFSKHLSIIGSTMGPQTEYEYVMGLVFSGRLHPLIDTIYPLSDGTAALERLDQGETAGKLVLIPNA
ncbi:MAG: alcohol dehydrogenase catalytic domain-containing protein [Candidatus Promineifilaceae bacterium]